MSKNCGNGLLSIPRKYRKVASSRPVYYSILNSFGQIPYNLHKCATNQDSLLLATLQYVYGHNLTRNIYMTFAVT